MTWNATSVSTGTLTYSVDGVFVAKLLERFLIRYDNYNGTYIGGFQYGVAGCFNPSNNVAGTVFATIQVTQSGQTMSVNIVGQATGVSITITGTLTQQGQFGSVLGSYTSNVGEAGNVSLFEANGQINAFTTRFSFTSTNNGCTTVGSMGGIRQRP